MMLKVGLTGNIGSGKTLIAEIFRLLGIPVFQADSEAKKLYLRSEIQKQITVITEKSVFDDDGKLDRKKMAEILFSNQEKLQKVNHLIHPMVRKMFIDFTEKNSAAPYCIYEAAIIVESGYYKQLDKLVVVRAPENVRIERVMKRDNIPAAEVHRRAKHQLSDESGIKLADWIIDNDASRMVIPQVLHIDQELRKLT